MDILGSNRMALQIRQPLGRPGCEVSGQLSAFPLPLPPAVPKPSSERKPQPVPCPLAPSGAV